MKTRQLSAEQGMNVGVCGISGAGKTWAASTAPSPVFLLTEPNAYGTISSRFPHVAVATSPSELLKNDVPPEMPICVEFFDGTPRERTDAIQAVCSGIAKNKEDFAKTGRKSVVFDSLTDYHSLLIEGQTWVYKNDQPTDQLVPQIAPAIWGKIGSQTLSVLQKLRPLTNHGINLLWVMGIKPEYKEPPGAGPMAERVFSGYVPLFSGQSQQKVMFQMMAVCTMETIQKQTAGGVKVSRFARFTGTSGHHVFKGMGSLGIEEPDFNIWKDKAFKAEGESD